MSSIEVCAKGSDPVDCAAPFIQDMLRTNSPAQIFNALSANFSPTQCHYFGHLVGEDLYKSDKSVEKAMAYCVPTCADACIHGVIGEAFLEQAGISDFSMDMSTSTDMSSSMSMGLNLLSNAQLLQIGTRLCTTGDTCHGVGHALYLAYHSMPQATQMCHEIGGPYVEDCLRGNFMEYADELGSVSAWDNPSTGTTTAMSGMQMSSSDDPSPTPTDEETFPEITSSSPFCSFASLEDTAACFYYFPQMVQETLAAQGAQSSRSVVNADVQQVCASLSDTYDRRACDYGLGASFFQSVTGNSQSSTKGCDLFSGADDRTACVLGLVSMVMEYSGTQTAFGICGAETGTAQSLCYESVFLGLSESGQSVIKASALCPADMCMAASKDYTGSSLSSFFADTAAIRSAVKVARTVT